mgnify:CR=1 FL=1
MKLTSRGSILDVNSDCIAEVLKGNLGKGGPLSPHDCQPRAMKFIALLVALVATVAAANEDPLRNALMMQTKEKLFEIAQKAGIHGYDEDTEIDTMRKLVYEHAQQEKAEGMVRKRWDGTDMPAKAKAPAAAKASAKAEKPKAALPSDMSSRVFAKLDADQDGKLSRAEMQPMIDTTNAAAEAAGEAVPSDFFGSLDKDKARSTLL